MSATNWRDVMKRIQACRNLGSPSATLSSLHALFRETNDAMVAFALGEEHEQAGDYGDAREWFSKAEELFPLPKYKQNAAMAVARLDRIRGIGHTRDIVFRNLSKVTQVSEFPKSLLDYDPRNTLFIVSCTKSKIWESSPSAPDYVPARIAYTGESFRAFLRWAEEHEIEKSGFSWVILSGRYGYIEPWHPIANYDIAIDDAAAHPITEDALVNQAKQFRFHRGPGGSREFQLTQFTQIVCVNCSETYMKKIAISFPNSRIEKVSV